MARVKFAGVNAEVRLAAYVESALALTALPARRAVCKTWPAAWAAACACGDSRGRKRRGLGRAVLLAVGARRRRRAAVGVAEEELPRGVDVGGGERLQLAAVAAEEVHPDEGEAAVRLGDVAEELEDRRVAQRVAAAAAVGEELCEHRLEGGVLCGARAELGRLAQQQADEAHRRRAHRAPRLAEEGDERAPQRAAAHPPLRAVAVLADARR